MLLFQMAIHNKSKKHRLEIRVVVAAHCWHTLFGFRNYTFAQQIQYLIINDFLPQTFL